MPLGVELAPAIANLLTIFSQGNGPTSLHAAVELYAAATTTEQLHFQPRLHQLRTTAAAIASALELAPSIDAYVENQSHNPDVGVLAKLGIVSCLLESEQNSDLFVPLQRDSGLVAWLRAISSL